MNYIAMPGLESRPKVKPLTLRFFSIKRIINAVERHFNLTHKDLITKSRNRFLVYPRQVCLYLLATNTPLTQSAVGMLLNRDHYATRDAIEKINDFMHTDERVREEIREITENI